MPKLALVTGASSGIGRALAQRLAADGHDLVAIGRRRDRLEALATSCADVTVEPLVADLSTDDGIRAVAEVCGSRPLTTLVNSAGLAHYMPFADLPAEKATELIYVKELAPTLLTRAAVPGMLERGEGAIVNIAGMIAFSGPAGPEQMPRRAVYTGTLAHMLAWTQQLHAELSSEGIRVQVVCPGIVATEFHERQGMDLSAVPRMSPDDVVAASLRGLERGEVVCARVSSATTSCRRSLTPTSPHSPPRIPKLRGATDERFGGSRCWVHRPWPPRACHSRHDCARRRSPASMAPPASLIVAG